VTIAIGLLPVFFALAAGYAAGKIKLIDNKNVAGFDNLTVNIALPLALFCILAGAKRADVIAHWTFALSVFAVTGLAYVLTYVLERKVWKQSARSAAVMAITAGVPNTAAVGFPIAVAVLGRTGALAVATSLAVGAIVLSPATIAIIDRAEATASNGPEGTHKRPSMLAAVAKALRAPVVIAPILGVAWSLSGFTFPSLVNITLSELGALTSGLTLFLTGLVLSAQRIIPNGNVVTTTLITDVVRPVLAIAVVELFHVSRPMAPELVLLMAFPSGFFGLLLALNHGVDSRLSSATVFYSTLLSIGTLSVVILLLPVL
jgi:malonate transporter and related proteins